MVDIVRARRAFGHTLWGIVAAAFAIRLAAMGVLHSYAFPPAQDHYLFGTEMGRVARSLVAGRGFASPLHGETGPTAMVGPIYPLVIAAVFKLWGIYSTASAIVLLALNAVFSALTGAVIYRIGQAAVDDTTAAWASWAWVILPTAVYWPILWVWDTSLSALLFALICVATLRVQRPWQFLQAMWYGVLWGITVLTNTTFLPLLPFFIVWIAYHAAQQRAPWVRSAATVVVAFGLVLAPWMIRNELVFGHLLLRSNFGLELAQGNSPGASGPRAWWLHPAFNSAEMARYRVLGELRYMADKQHEAMTFIAQQPVRFADATAMRALFFWFGTERPAGLFHFPEVLYGITSLLAFVGLTVMLVRRSPAGLPFAAIVVVFPLVYYVTHPDARFRYLVEPELMVLAAYGGLTAWWHRG
jgi:hypothetical protein